MAFPRTANDLVAEMYVAGDWEPIQLPEAPNPGKQIRDDKIKITRGRQNEQSAVSPSKCQFKLGNKDGVYSPRNPLSPWYGYLLRNTPIRLAIRRERDTYNRVVANGWTNATSGEAWTIGGSTGWVPAEFSVDGTQGIHLFSATNSYRHSRFQDALYRDVEVAVTFDIAGISNIAGADVEPSNIMFRGRSVSDYYMVRVVITPAELVTVSVIHFNGTVYHAPVTVLTGWAGQKMRVKALIEGQNVRVKCWVAANPEPYDWALNAWLGTTEPYFGWVGVRSGVASGNSNTKPLRFEYTDWQVRVPRFCGEISKWPAQQDDSSHDQFVNIEANGLLRRLGQGKAPLRSTLFRALTSVPTGLVAYWPVEEGRNATSVATPILGAGPMRIVGSPAFATFNDIDASAALPEVRKSSLTGDVPPYTATGETEVRWVCHIPAGGTVDQDVITRVFCSGGTLKFVDVMYHSGGGLSVKAYDLLGNEVFDTDIVAFGINGKSWRMQLDLDQDGADIDITIATLEVGAQVGGFFSGTLAGFTLGIASLVVINPYMNLDTVAIGHISVHNTISSLFDLHQQLNAYDGEASGVRARRLSQEEGYPFDWIGDLNTTERMGPQRPDSFLNLVNECATVDMGTLYEPRGSLGLVYRTRRALERQTPTLSTSYRNLRPGGQAVDDDQSTRNNITITRREGSSYQATQQTGPLSVQDAENGGVGRYDTSVTVNCYSDAQLPYLGGWLLHLGTVDEARYPKLEIDLASTAFAASATLTASALALSVDDRLVLSDPPAGQAPDDISQLARGFTEEIQPWGYRITVNAAPESPYQTLVLDDPNARLAPLADCQLASGAASGGTSLSVTSPTGPLWTTAAGQMPIGIKVAGEEISVGAISGAASPQTFNPVTRSVNTVVKDQLAGARVSLAHPKVLAL